MILVKALCGPGLLIAGPIGDGCSCSYHLTVRPSGCVSTVCSDWSRDDNRGGPPGTTATKRSQLGENGQVYFTHSKG